MNNALRNRLLAGLNPRELDRVRPALTRVPLRVNEVLYDRDEPISFVHFIEKGVVSITNRAKSRSIIEVATVGFEGMVGLPVFLRGNSFLLTAFTQVAGEAYRMKSDDLVRLTQDHSDLRTSLSRYVQALLTQIAQAATCNQAHPVRQRAARWLLMTHDRVGTDRFRLPMRFLGQMLGITSTRSHAVAGSLQKEELIRYSKDVLSIVDRRGLEAASCECYHLVRREFDRLTASPRGKAVGSDA